MKLKTLLANAGIACAEDLADIEISKIVSDSRLTCANCLYVCIRGLHKDGHSYINDAITAGAAVVVIEDGAEFDNKYKDVIFLSVAKTRAALAYLFDAWHGNPSNKMKYVAVTGTNGKTSVTHILKKIFELSLYRCGLVGTISCLSVDRRLISDNRDIKANMTTPDPEQLYSMLAEMVNDGVEYVFIEASSHALALDKLAPIKFTASVFTNLTPDHLDFHGSMDNYLTAKKKLFDESEISVINKDSIYYDDIAVSAKFHKVSCSLIDNTADYRAVSVINRGFDGIEYTLNSHRGALKIQSKLPGEFAVINTLEAAACALELGILPQVVSQAIACVDGAAGRMEKVDVGKSVGFSVLIDYAHTPDALEKLLNSVRRLKREEQKLILLFGCGGDRDRYKRSVMGEIAVRLSDFVIITSDNCRSEDPQSIINDILEGVGGYNNYIVIRDRAEAIEYAVLSAEESHIIVLAGKGHEAYDINGNGRVAFSEKQIVMSALNKRKFEQ